MTQRNKIVKYNSVLGKVVSISVANNNCRIMLDVSGVSNNAMSGLKGGNWLLREFMEQDNYICNHPVYFCDPLCCCFFLHVKGIEWLYNRSMAL